MGLCGLALGLTAICAGALAADAGKTLEVKLGETIPRTWDDVKKADYAYGPKQDFEAAANETHVWLPYGSKGVYFEAAGVNLSDPGPEPGTGCPLVQSADGNTSGRLVFKLHFDKPIGAFRFSAGWSEWGVGGDTAGGVEYGVDGRKWSTIRELNEAKAEARIIEPFVDGKKAFSGLGTQDLYIRCYSRDKSNPEAGFGPGRWMKFRLGGDPAWGDAATTFFACQLQVWVAPAEGGAAGPVKPAAAKVAAQEPGVEPQEARAAGDEAQAAAAEAEAAAQEAEAAAQKAKTAAQKARAAAQEARAAVHEAQAAQGAKPAPPAAAVPTPPIPDAASQAASGPVGTAGGSLEIKLGTTIPRSWEDVKQADYAYGPKQEFDPDTKQTQIWLPYGAKGVYYEKAGLKLTDPEPGAPPMAVVLDGFTCGRLVYKLHFDKPISGFSFAACWAEFGLKNAVAGVEYSVDGRQWSPVKEVTVSGIIAPLVKADGFKATGLKTQDLYIRCFSRDKEHPDAPRGEGVWMKLWMGGDPSWGDIAVTFFKCQVQLWVTPAE
jgi:pyruvate/2-oxoglutarate dehydrogenase complex dihydrolipoamide acyltransferase (E2) component